MDFPECTKTHLMCSFVNGLPVCLLNKYDCKNHHSTLNMTLETDVDAASTLSQIIREPEESGVCILQANIDSLGAECDINNVPTFIFLPLNTEINVTSLFTSYLPQLNATNFDCNETDVYNKITWTVEPGTQCHYLYFESTTFSVNNQHFTTTQSQYTTQQEQTSLMASSTHGEMTTVATSTERLLKTPSTISDVSSGQYSSTSLLGTSQLFITSPRPNALATDAPGSSNVALWALVGVVAVLLIAFVILIILFIFCRNRKKEVVIKTFKNEAYSCESFIDTSTESYLAALYKSSGLPNVQSESLSNLYDVIGETSVSMEQELAPRATVSVQSDTHLNGGGSISGTQANRNSYDHLGPLGGDDEESDNTGGHYHTIESAGVYSLAKGIIGPRL